MSVIQLAGCVIQNQDGHILLVHRNNGKHVQWEIPGGKIDEGEEAIATAVRELKEELGVVVRVIKHLGERAFEHGDREFHYIWFQAEIVKGTPTVMEPDVHDDLDFFSLASLHERALELSPNTANFLEELHAGRVVL